MLMMHGICLNGFHGIRLNLKRLVVFIDIIFPDPSTFYAKSYYAPLWCDFVILLLIMLVHALIMLVMLILIRLYL